MAVTQTTRALVRERAGRRCEYCHADERWQFVAFTIDHVVPRSEGGSDDEVNLALACRNCNERRGNRGTAGDPETGEAAPIFNPRQDVWAEHFAWSPDGLRLVGLTPTGRATARLLDSNDDRHGEAAIRVRRRDAEDGYHPPPGDPVLSE